MDERPGQPEEGKLVADALARKGLSIREASRRAGISYGRWRQITSGYQNVSPGSYARVRAPAATLARMAAIVDVTPAQMEAAGRPDAAEILTEIQVPATPAQGSGGPHFRDPRLAAIWAIDGLPEDVRRGMIRFAEGWLNIPPESGDAAQMAG